MAAMLTRFKNLVKLAAAPVDEGAAREVAAAQAFALEVESAGLVCRSFLYSTSSRFPTQTIVISKSPRVPS